MTGTIINILAIIAGSLAGMTVRSRLSPRAVEIVFQGIGLFTLVLGFSMSLSSERYLPMILSIVAGSLLGQWMRLDRKLDGFSEYLRRKSRPGNALPAGDDEGEYPAAMASGKGAAGFTEGFLTATMLYCVGSMSILGAIEDGMGLTPNLLYTKSIMDGVTSIVLASSFGVAILFSALPVFLFQGSLTLLAYYVSGFMSEGMISDLTAVGGILLVGLGINILKIREINVINMLPALVLIILLSRFWG